MGELTVAIDARISDQMQKVEVKTQELQTALEEKQSTNLEESKKQIASLKSQVLKIAMALKGQSKSLKSQGEHLSELKNVSPPRDNAQSASSEKAKKEGRSSIFGRLLHNDDLDVQATLKQHVTELDKINAASEAQKESMKKAFDKVRAELDQARQVDE